MFQLQLLAAVLGGFFAFEACALTLKLTEHESDLAADLDSLAAAPRRQAEQVPRTALSFAIPGAAWERTSSLRAKDARQKRKGFAALLPSIKHTYALNSESEYYSAYSDALFGITFKKGGWDCLRHYEIIASGTVPYFMDIDKIPNGTMDSFPKELVRRAMRLRGVPGEGEVRWHLNRGTVPEIRRDIFDFDGYKALREKIMRYAGNNLLTRHMAASVVPAYPPRRVLVQSWSNLTDVDYLLDLLTIGLVENNHEVYSIPAVKDLLYKDFSGDPAVYYGKGFTLQRSLRRPSRSLFVTEQNASSVQFDDYIVSTKSDTCYPPLVPGVAEAGAKVVALDGNDMGTFCPVPHVAKELFLREIYNQR